AVNAVLGMLWLLGTLVAAFRLLLRRPMTRRTHRIDAFLTGWFLLELAAYFPLTPFPAVRRVMGLLVVGTLLAGRLASRTCSRRPGRTMVWCLCAGNVVVGLLVYAVDAFDAFALKNAAERSASLVRDRDPQARIWFVGHWGFQFYAERAGLISIVPDR